MEVGAGADGDPQHPLLFLVQAGLVFPQWLQLSSPCLTAFPQDWLVHHHQACAAPGAGGDLLGLLLVGGGGPLPPPVAVLLGLVPVPEGDLFLFTVVGAVTGA